MSMIPFSNRAEAGRALARRLLERAYRGPLVVLALPRGGVPVAAEIARALNAPLDLLQVRKIGLPWQPELAVAAVVDGVQPRIVVDEELMRLTGVDRAAVDVQARRELAEIERRRMVYGRGRTAVPVQGTTAIVVDDGIATGTTARAALRALADLHPARRILAVPVAAPQALASLRGEVDEIVCLAQPASLGAVGQFYLDFHQVSDDEVIAALDGAAGARE